MGETDKRLRYSAADVMLQGWSEVDTQRCDRSIALPGHLVDNTSGNNRIQTRQAAVLGESSTAAKCHSPYPFGCSAALLRASDATDCSQRVRSNLRHNSRTVPGGLDHSLPSCECRCDMANWRCDTVQKFMM